MSELPLAEIHAAGRELVRAVELTQRFRAFQELFDELCCEAKRDGYFTWVNSQWEKYLGYTPKEMLAKPWLDFVHPDDVEATIAAAQTMNTQGIINFENRYLHKNGKEWKRLRWKTIAFNGNGTALAKAEIIGTEPAHG